MPFTPNYSPQYCKALQQKANWACADPMNVRSKVGMLSALLLPQNKAAIQFPDNGKYQPIEMQYSQRALQSEITDTVNICSPAQHPRLKSRTVEIMETTAIARTFDEAQMRRLCDTEPNILDHEIQLLFDALARDLNQKLLLYASLETTLLYGGSSPAPLNLIHSGPPVSINFMDYSRLMRDLRLIGCGNMPILIGAGELPILASLLGVGCCNSATGVRIDQLNNQFAYFDDVQIDTVIAPNAMIAMVPGSIQLVTWYENPGETILQKGRAERGRVIDPVTGMMYDLTIFWDDCSNQYNINIYVKWAVVFLADDLYQPGDPLYQTKGFIKYNTIP